MTEDSLPLVICTNGETLHGWDWPEGSNWRDDAETAAVFDAADRVLREYRINQRIDVRTSGRFEDWHGGRYDSQMYGWRRIGLVAIPEDAPAWLVDLATAASHAMDEEVERLCAEEEASVAECVATEAAAVARDLLEAATAACLAIEAAAAECGYTYSAAQESYGVRPELLIGDEWISAGEIDLDSTGDIPAAVRLCDCDGESGSSCRTVAEVEAERDRWTADVARYTSDEDDAAYYGDLHDYLTGAYLRPATEAERDASRLAAKHDGGAGVILIDPDTGEIMEADDRGADEAQRCYVGE